MCCSITYNTVFTHTKIYYHFKKIYPEIDSIFKILGKMKWSYPYIFAVILPLLFQVSCEQHLEEDGGSKDGINNISNQADDNVHRGNSDKVHSRQKRYVYINTQSPVDIGFLIVVPYSFALPTFNLQTSRRLKRSIEMEKEQLANLTAEEILPSDSYDEPAYAIELGKMNTYFTILGVDEDICQQRLICEIFTDPENHKPLSDMFAKKLTVDHGPVADKYSSRYYRYTRALQQGLSGGELACQNLYKRCPYSVKDRIHVPALHFWTLLTNMLGIEFRDD